MPKKKRSQYLTRRKGTRKKRKISLGDSTFENNPSRNETQDCSVIRTDCNKTGLSCIHLEVDQHASVTPESNSAMTFDSSVSDTTISATEDEDHVHFLASSTGLSDILLGIEDSNVNTREEVVSSNEATSEPQITTAVESYENPSEAETTLLDIVALEVNRSVAGPLFAKRSGSGISVLWISKTRPTSVVGEICVLSSGKVEVYVKGYQINADHILWTKIAAPVRLVSGEVTRFVNHVNHAVMMTREFAICGGVKELKHLWGHLTQCFVERDQWREPDTCRSEICELLVPPQRIRCLPCKSLCLKLRNRKRKSVDKIG